MDKPQEQPTRAGFFEARTRWSVLKQVLFLEPLPGGSRWAAAFGSLLLFTFVLQVITGILLVTDYAPSVETAWPSVKFIQDEVPLGAFIRALHHWGSSAMVILLLVHLVQVFVWGAYKKPREFTWMVGVLLLLCTIGLGFTGYVLPWDQKAYWATKVGLGIASAVPWIGDGLRTLLQGGPQMGNMTLTHFFCIHAFILPGVVILLVVVHLYMFRVHGVTPGWWQSAERLKLEEEPFWPKQVLKDGLLALVFLIGLALWCHYRPAPLEAQADPSQPYEARPEWYFMFLFQLLRYFHGPYEIVGTFVLPTAFFLILFFWPFLDRSPHRDPRRRPIAMSLLGIGTSGLVGLTIFAIATDVRMAEPKQAIAALPVLEPAGPIQRGEVATVYNTNCASCHAVDGSGQHIRAAMPTIPDFTSLAWQLSQTDLEIIHRIHDGHELLMPAFRIKLSQQQIVALAIYVRAFAIAPIEAGVPTAEAQAATAPVAAHMSPVQIFRAYCLACHDVDGSGQLVRKAMPEIPDFTDSKWQASRRDADFKQSILDGKGKLMLPMKDKLGPADADAMVAFLRAFRDSKQVVSVESHAPLVPSAPEFPTVVNGPGATPTEKLSPPSASAETATRTRLATGLFRQYCLSCHGVDGRGGAMRDAMPTIPDFTSIAWQERVNDLQLAVSILDGKGTWMPAFSRGVAPEQARDLAMYIRAFGPAGVTAHEVPASDFEKRFGELQQQWNELQKELEETPKPSEPR